VFLKRTPCESIHEDCFICLESQSWFAIYIGPICMCKVYCFLY
jgi:hypothetical protein